MQAASPSRLRLVATQPTWAPARPPIDLTVTPFRPGELPQVTRLALDSSACTEIERLASAARVPIEIFIRLAVEAARLLLEIAALTEQPTDRLCALLDHAAARVTATTTLDAPGMSRYARGLRMAVRPRKSPPGDLAVRLPEEMAGAWRRAAREADESLGAWVTARVADAPPRCVDWEIAAATECRTLGEWAYASALCSIARSNA